MGIRVYWVANVHMCIQYPSQRPHVDCSAELISSEMTPKMRWQNSNKE